MRSRHWKVLALATVATLALSACGGGDQNAGDQGTASEDTGMTQTGGMDQNTGMDQPGGAAQDTGMGQQAANLPAGVTQEQVNQGRQLFDGQANCHTCHGPNAKGTQLAPDLTDNEWLNTSGRNMSEIENIIRNGVPNPKQHPAPMPPMGGANLNDQQIKALAAYVVSLGQG